MARRHGRSFRRERPPRSGRTRGGMMAIGGGGGQREIARKNGPDGGSCPRSGSFPGGGPGARRMTAARRVGVDLTCAAADSPRPGIPAGRVRLPPCVRLEHNPGASPPRPLDISLPTLHAGTADVRVDLRLAAVAALPIDHELPTAEPPGVVEGDRVRDPARVAGRRLEQFIAEPSRERIERPTAPPHAPDRCLPVDCCHVGRPPNGRKTGRVGP
jgi:hypothetical protein